jgi:8-hydroxy-5-deazaflavin:NADPH oxidoreductase
VKTIHERPGARRGLLRGAVRALGVAAVAGGLALGPLGLSGAGPTIARQSLRIGIIGSGQMGGALGIKWAQAGHQVFFSSRHPEELADLIAEAGPNAQAGLPEDAARFGDVVVIAVPYGALPQVGQDYGALMQGKVVIDVGNPREDRDGPMAADAIARGTGVASAEYLPGVRLVRALNAVAFTMVRDAPRSPERIGVPIAGDDANAVEIATRLVEDAGFDPVVVGGLERAREFDRGTDVYVRGLSASQLREALGLQ